MEKNKKVYIVVEEDGLSGKVVDNSIVDVFENFEDAKKCLQECKEDFYQNTNFDEDDKQHIDDQPAFFQYYESTINYYELSIIEKNLK